ncbi:MAG TPA: signal peptidase I [Actinomycetota bacterium]|nr:signal peptidase I [Actinomycetota bacterium]
MSSFGEGRRSAGPVAGKGEGMSFLKELPILIVVAIAIALLIKTFVVQAFYIPSGSMENTLLINDRVLVSKFVYDFGSPRRGQIVVFVAPPNVTDAPVPPTGFGGFINSIKEAIGLPSTERDFIKRVVAVGGDTLQIKNAKLYVNGKAVNEPYLDANARLPSSMPNFGPITVAPHRLFVMGDNRGDSDDSRVFNTIPVSSVVGEAFVRIWPLNRFHFF